MVYSLTYTRPPHRDSTTSSINCEKKQDSINESIKTSSSCSMCCGIPEPLSFDRIISGGTCPPCTLRDFMNYLKYIEHSAENLQFFLWLRAYTQKFNETPEAERKLSPEWEHSDYETEQMAAHAGQSRKLKVSADTAKALKGTGLDSSAPIITEHETDPFHTPPRTPSSESSRGHATPSILSADEKSFASSTQKTATDYRRKAGEEYDTHGMKWQPFTIQPFRDEIARIISIYIAPDGARQLNLSHKERAAVLHALENTTHPSAFRAVARSVEYSLRCQAHPNFIRWTICNGNRPRVIFARGLGVGGILGGIIVDILITLSGAPRAWRVIAFILYFIGISTLIAAWKGMCVVLHGMHHRHLRPWELFTDEDEAAVEMKGKGDSFDSFESYHSYETEPWVARYEKRNTVRKIFDREVWVEEPALRQIQDTIFLQALIGAIFGGAVLTAIFVAVPGGNFF